MSEIFKSLLLIKSVTAVTNQHGSVYILPFLGPPIMVIGKLCNEKSK